MFWFVCYIIMSQFIIIFCYLRWPRWHTTGHIVRNAHGCKVSIYLQIPILNVTNTPREVFILHTLDNLWTSTNIKIVGRKNLNIYNTTGGLSCI